MRASAAREEEVERGGRGEARRDAPEWPRVPLGELAHIIAGQSPPGSTYRREPVGLPFFQGKADFGDRHPVARVWCTEPNKIAQPGDVLMSIRAPVGPTNVADTECCIGRGLAALRCGPTLDRDYLLWFLRSIEADIAKQGSGSTFDAINRDQLEALEIPLPPLAEQERIAGRLTEQLGGVERARDAAAQRLAAAEALPAALLREVFDGPQASGWETVRLGDVCRCVEGQVDPRDAEYARLPHINGENIESGTGRLLEVRTAAEDGLISGKYLFEPGMILYSKLRPYLRKVTIAPTRGVCSADMYPLMFDPARVDPAFALYSLLAEPFTTYAVDESRRARMPKLNREQLFAWDFPLPPDLPTQRRLAAELTQRLAAAEGVIARCREELAAIEALPASLLRDAFGGGRDGQEPEGA